VSKKILKRVLIGFAVFYAIGGLFVSSCLAYAVPATNIYGRLYLAAIWPAMVSAGTLHTPTPPIPDWCFTFK
jgi:hypothetical protein